MTAAIQPIENPGVFADLVARVAALVESEGVFDAVKATPERLECAARDAAAPAWYRLVRDDGRVWIELVTPDRWLSQSIEQDLVHTGDHLDELLEEELVDLGYRGPRLAVEHFRSEDKLFTFRSPLSLPGSVPDAAALCATCLRAYEACFRRLGDMAGGEES